jgi:hypothetical protein
LWSPLQDKQEAVCDHRQSQFSTQQQSKREKFTVTSPASVVGWGGVKDGCIY